jgi:hypothetical protein
MPTFSVHDEPDPFQQPKLPGADEPDAERGPAGAPAAASRRYAASVKTATWAGCRFATWQHPAIELTPNGDALNAGRALCGEQCSRESLT